MKKFKVVIAIIIFIIIAACLKNIIASRMTINLQKSVLNNTVTNTTEQTDDLGAEYKKKNKDKLQKIDNIGDYYVLRACVHKYYLSVAGYFKADEADKDNYIQNIYNLLDVNESKISTEDIKNKLVETNDIDLNIEDVLFLAEYDKDIYVYFVKGNVRDVVTNQYTNFFMVVKQDRKTKSFNILSDEYTDLSEYANLKEGKKLVFDYPDNIQRNEYNMFGNYQISIDDYAKDLVNQIREDLLYNPKRAYELLDDDFKKDSFKSYEEFEQYVESLRKEIFLLTYKNYSLGYDKGYAIYNCEDKNNNFQIKVITKYPMEYNYIIEEI